MIRSLNLFPFIGTNYNYNDFSYLPEDDAANGTKSLSKESEGSTTQVQRQPTNLTELEMQAQQIQPIHALPSALKKSSAFPAAHRRVFSHGQITFSCPSDTMGEAVVTRPEILTNATNSNRNKAQVYKGEDDINEISNVSGHPPPTAIKKGHRRGNSKTDFILPPGHEERERKRALQR